MKKAHFITLLAPALFAAIVAIIAFYYAWSFHTSYIEQAEGYSRVEKQISSIQCLSTDQADILVSSIKRNHEVVYEASKTYFSIGVTAAVFAWLVVGCVVRVRKTLSSNVTPV